MSTPSRFGRQPARAVLRAHGLSVAAAARMIGVPHTHFGSAIYGKARPVAVVRERLPEVLGVPLEELFTAEALAEPTQWRAWHSTMYGEVAE